MRVHLRFRIVYKNLKLINLEKKKYRFERFLFHQDNFVLVKSHGKVMRAVYANGEISFVNIVVLKKKKAETVKINIKIIEYMCNQLNIYKKKFKSLYYSTSVDDTQSK